MRFHSSILLACSYCFHVSSSTRRLAPQSSCTLLVYNNLSDRPKEVADRSGKCPPEGTHRVFLLNDDASLAQPVLQEMRPRIKQRFQCLPNKTCVVHIAGFGLQAGDGVLLTKEKGKCGTKVEEVWRTEVTREAATQTIVAYDESGRGIRTHRIYSIIEIPATAFGEHESLELCYSSKLSSDAPIKERSSEQFFYPVGKLQVGEASYDCNFEEGSLESCGFNPHKESYDLDFSWTVKEGPSTVPGTGPRTDADGSETGHYAVMISPGYLSDGAAAVMVGPPLAFPEGEYCVSFAYNMHGEDVNSLRVYLWTVPSGTHLANSTDISQEDVWGAPKWVAVGNKGAEWHHAGFTHHFGATHSTQLVFEALAGRSEKGNIAVDDVRVQPGQCPPEVQSMPSSKVGTKDLICGEVRMITGNHPDDKMWNLDGAVSCAGRGYSAAQLEHAWVPCCVPSFGSYTLLLHDRLNDGWEGSHLEMRFFDRVMTFGDEMKKSSGDVKLPVVIGQLQIENATYADQGIQTSVKVVGANQHVWCGVSEAAPDGNPRNPTPRSSLMKQYGVRSAHPTTKEGEIVDLTITNPPGVEPFIFANNNYDLYCYTEPADYDIRRQMNETAANDLLMDDRQIAATRFRITADNDPPTLTAQDIAIDAVTVKIKVKATEPAKAWCYPFIKDHQNVTKQVLLAVGHVVRFEDNEQIATFEFKHLASDSDYRLHCYAEDFAEPHKHGTPDDIIQQHGILLDGREIPVEFHTRKRVPEVRIAKVTTLSSGFDVFVEMDAPGTVWCAAAPETVEFPSVVDVQSAGAQTILDMKEFADDPHTHKRIGIRGVKAQTAYKIFCAASTSDQSMVTREKDMWRNAYPIVSYGRFCEIPGMPQIHERSTQATPFDPLNGDEELKVRRYVLGLKELNLEGVYRVNLLPNKTEIYNYYLHEGPFPKRYARVRAGRCINDRGFYEQIKVGPVDGAEDDFRWERIAEPVETSCGGYVPEGIFGRRLQAGNHNAFQKVLKESFGYRFNTQDCVRGHETCLRLGAITLEMPSESGRRLSESAGDSTLWIGLKHPDGTPLPFYFNVSPRDLGISEAESRNLADLPRLLDGKDWLGNHKEVWYNGHLYDSVDHLADEYEAGQAPRITINEIRQKAHAQSPKKRRLDPGPYPGAAGTAGFDLDRSRKRAGLEYKIPPEHVEPEGKRFTVKSHPGGQSFSIDYAGWNFTVTNDRDKSMQFWNLRFQNEQIAFQLGLQEALAHYTVSERTFFFMDSWYGGLGGAARPVLRGYECPKHGVLLFWDHSLCVWEQDMARPIRSHYRAGEIRDAAGHYALHVRQMLTVSNYDYVTTYVFHPSGHIEMKVEFTGELYAGIEVPWWSERQRHYGTQVTGSMRFAAMHAHIVVWRMDFDLGEDFQDNSVYFEEIVPDPKRIGANYLSRSFAEYETQAVVGVNATRQIAYEIVDEKRNTYGNYGGWRIFPGHSLSPNAPNFELYSGPAAWAKYKAFTTVFKYSELDGTLPRDNKFAGDPAVCVDRMISDNETLRHTDLVTWMSMGFMHIPCAEDYPLTIPIGNTLSALVRPNNWFLEDPSMDLHNAIGGDFEDPGQCAVIRRNLFEAMDVSHGRGPVLL